jgi:heptosyltransferase-2
MRSLLLIARLRARVKIGYKGSIAGLVFHHRVRRPMELPEALRQLALLEPLEPVWSDRLRGFAQRQALPGGQRADGSLVDVPEWAEMKSIDRLRIENLSESARKIAVRLGHAPLAFLAPGSVWPTKMWRAEGFAQAAAELSKRGFKVVLMGSPEERDICERIRQSAPSAEVIAGETDLFATTQLLSMASIFIGNDSGAMHLAALAGVPSVAVFGPTILEFGYRPWESRAAVVQVPREKMSCRPCGKHGARSCPLGTHACMREVQASEVVTTALRLSGIDA